MHLTGEKIILREFRADDLEPMQKWVNDEEVTKYLYFSTFPRTLEDTRSYINSQLNRSNNTNVFFAVDYLPEKVYVGTVGLKNIDYISRNCELAITIGNYDYSGKGIGTEAVKLIVKYAFDYLNMNKVYLNFLSENKAAMRTYQKCGFVECGVFRDHIYKDGRYYDLVHMELLKG